MTLATTAPGRREFRGRSAPGRFSCYFFLSWLLVGGSLLTGTEVDRWFQAQVWERDTPGPVLALGEAGAFDDTHIFAPAVALEDGHFWVWYSGSRGEVAERVFRLGLAQSEDGKQFTKAEGNPVFEFGDNRHSILTAALLREPGGAVLRENGKLRLWFSSTWFEGGGGQHALYETFSRDGVKWEPPSPALLEGVYAPTVLKIEAEYRMWYTDVRSEPWRVRHAASEDGRHWRITEEVCLEVDQAWEQGRLFYPTVLRVDGVYLMWYGSYWRERANTTALGFAVSSDGLHWKKHPDNPVLRPDPERPWESHYVTSQSVLRLEDGSFRIWYASRKRPPFTNKYFAIGTARWKPRRGGEP